MSIDLKNMHICKIMENKYKLTEETINVNGKTLYRIEALKDFNDVKKGDKGGFVESDNNLTQSGDCWIYDNAKVFGDALVYGNAAVCDNASVYGHAIVYGDAIVFDNAAVCGIAMVYEHANGIW